MGVGGESVRVRVEPLVPVAEADSSITELVKGVLEALLTGMGVAALVVPQAKPVTGEEEAATPFVFDIEGDDLGILIGRRGQTLACLQFIVRLIVSHKTKVWVPIAIDVEGYKQRRSERLRVLAQNLAERVKARGGAFTLEPMLAYERRIIHLTLADHPDVTTESIGEGESRKVVIRPKR